MSTQQDKSTEVEAREDATRYARELYDAMRRGEISYEQAVDRIPQPFFYLFAGRPGRIGFTLEQHGQQATLNTMGPLYKIESMSLAVLALTEKYREGGPMKQYEAIEYNWLILRGYVYNAVAPGRFNSWIDAIVVSTDAEDSVVRALEAGAAVYNAELDRSVWQKDSWEISVTTEQLIELFRQACQQARHEKEQWERMIS